MLYDNELTFKEVLEYFNIQDKYDLKILAEALQVLPKDLKDCEFRKENNYLFVDCGCCEFLVFNDYDDVEEYAKNELYTIYEECYESDIPENLRYYVDVDAWVEDVLKYDGAGSVIASYDGDEREITINGKTYYIYRVN